LTAVLSRDPEIEVVGCAPEPAVARQMIKDLNPDVITLDIEMPHMTGLEFLEKIMRLRPMPVVMVSTLTQRGAEITLGALEMGAVDYFAKPTDNVAHHLDAAAQELALKVKTAARAQVRARAPESGKAEITPDASFKPGDAVIGIGSSTGGVEALIRVLSHFPENCPPTVITQHMPAHFTTTFAERLNRICKPSVGEATDGAPLKIGQIYLAPGGDQHLEVTGVGTFRCHLIGQAPVSGHRPSVDVLFHSLARTVGARGIGVILTGMGRDGADGLKAMRAAGAATVGQDEATSIVYGMPRAAFEIGAVQKQAPLERIGVEIMRICKARAEGADHAVRR
jgi:two-component system chemotaxis response regulator CheB